MAEFLTPAIWIACAGGVGGLLNGAASHNFFLWPVRLAGYSPIRIVRPGLAVNVLAGTAAAGGTFFAFTGTSSSTWSLDGFLSAFVVALILGALTARWITNEADKQILRAALLKACAAPAAHPEVATTIASAPPHTVLRAADDLAPRFRGHD